MSNHYNKYNKIILLSQVNNAHLLNNYKFHTLLVVW
jgi:hypothetical protein